MTKEALSAVHKTRLLYRGDMWAAAFYLLSSMVLFFFALLLQSLQLTPGFEYLAISFHMFSAYCLGKGLFLFFTSRKRYRHFFNYTTLNTEDITSEIQYTQQRIQKKGKSRRFYVWVTIICIMACATTFFSPLKPIILGTCIPVALIGMIEMGVGLLTEFRLREYLRLLQRSTF
jgi:hypothetical protein